MYTTLRMLLASAFIFQVLSIPLLQSYPFIALLSGLSLGFVLNSASVIKNCLSVSIRPPIISKINDMWKQI